MIWHDARSTGSRLLGVMLVCVVWIGLAVRPSWAQTLVTIQNSKIAASVGQEDDLNGVNVAGRFGITEVGGNGAVLLQLPRSTDLKQLGSYVTVRIDGGTPFLPDGTVAEGVAGWDIAWGYEDTPDTDITGEWVQVPTVVSPTRIVARWRTVPDSSAEPPIPEIQVDLEMRIIYDMVLYRFTVTNKDTRAHTVGLRFAQDFAVPGGLEGPVVTPTTSGIVNETQLISTLIPAFWRVAPAGTTSTVGAVLHPSGVATYPTSPDRLVFGRTGNVTGPLWDFTPQTNETFVDPLQDGSAALYYNPMQYAPGQSRTFSMIFGAAGCSYEFGQRLAAGVEGPVSLKYDPSQPADKRLQPSPFKVTAFLYNLNTVALSNVQAVISLPAGLELAPGQNPLKKAPTIGVDGEVTFTWDVVPTGTVSGRLTYSVSLTAEPGGQGLSVARSIDIPALPTQDMGAGWRMVSFPYVLDDPTPAGAINVASGLYDLVRWNPGFGRYEAVQFLTPGEGYWLRLYAPSTVSLANAQPVKAPGGYQEVRLQNGWNQIGNPFLLPVRWGDLKVMSLDASDPQYLVPLSVAEAADFTRRWISPTIFYYDPAAGMYKFDQGYATELTPFAGYWVRANKPNLLLLVPEPSGRAVRTVEPTRAASATPGGWLLRLAVSDGKSTDGWNFIGVARDAGDGLDVRDVLKPPAPAEGVSLAVLREDLGAAPERLAQDVRSASGTRKVWRLAVSSQQPDAEVVLTWPNLSTLPRTHELYITDEATGRRESMRRVSSLRINTGPAGTRIVTIAAEPRIAGGAFRITSWNVVQTRSASSAAIGVATSQPASITVRVLSQSGAAVRRIATRADNAGQLTQITWDLRDSKGVSVPAGTYTVEIKATTPDGQSARVVAPLVVTR